MEMKQMIFRMLVKIDSIQEELRTNRIEMKADRNETTAGLEAKADDTPRWMTL
jgi:hypothetical protein